MIDEKYRCYQHKLDVICINCAKTTYKKYYKLLDFVKNFANQYSYGPDDALKLLEEIKELK